MKSLYVNTHATNAKEVKLDLIEKPKPQINQNECLIQVASSGINPSDALAIMGYFNHATLPRIPGRDFAGIVVEGPSEWIGKRVWGTGGGAGISEDGTQAQYIKLSLDQLAEIPKGLDPVAAGALLLPYVTAYYGLVKRAAIAENEAVLIVGALGQVGSAAMAICEWKKCRPIALVRKKELERTQQLGWNAIDSESDNLAERILSANNGKPIQVILNSVGNIYWHDFIKSLSAFGRIVTIGARENMREATINLFDLYRANQDLIGINTISLDFQQNAQLLNEIKEGFEKEKLKPLSEDQMMIYDLEKASQAYQQVLEGSAKRVVIKFI